MLARERRWRHPLRSLVVLPARRLYHLWTTPNIQPLSSSHRTPWLTVVEPLRSFLPALTVTTTLLGLLGLAVLWVRRRPAALLLTTAIIFRCGLLSMAGLCGSALRDRATPSRPHLGRRWRGCLHKDDGTRSDCAMTAAIGGDTASLPMRKR